MKADAFEHSDLDDIEDRFLALVVDADLPVPDEICKDARTGELTFIWRDRKLVVVVGPDGEVTDAPSGD